MEKLNMKTRDEQQQQQAQEYLTLITSVFPNCLWRFVENYDDIYCGFEFALEPGVLLIFKWRIDDHYRIKIEAIQTDYSSIIYTSDSFNSRYRLIFNGPIPSDSNYEPDFDFIKKVLLNYKLFSSGVVA